MKPENLPKYWGGELVDSNGDGMCRDKLNIPTDPIPHDLYWIPSKETPGKEDITCTCIPPGKAKVYTFVVLPEDKPQYIVINRQVKTAPMRKSISDTVIERLEWASGTRKTLMP